MRARAAPYAVRRSATGLGLFATEPIPKGTRIIEYTGPRVPNEQVEKSSGKYFFGLNQKWSIDGSRRDNIARYINHSCAPNAEAIIRRGRIWIWSRKNVKPDEEITYDYGKEYFDGIIKEVGCRCKKCRPRRRKVPARRAKRKSKPARRSAALARRPGFS